MTGQDFQDKLDAIALDLQTVGKGKTVKIALRGSNNDVTNFPLSSDVAGVVNDRQLTAIQDAINLIKPIADSYTTERGPVMISLEAFNLERAGHQALIDAATAARTALNTALVADVNYQAAKADLDARRVAPDYVAAVNAYQQNNVSEIFGNLSDSKGKYIG